MGLKYRLLGYNKVMFIASLFKWWYFDGWRGHAEIAMARLESALDYFSPLLLITTLFSLFRQDGAGRVDGPLEVKFQAFLGRLISRVLGAFIRSIVLVIGLVVIAALAVFSALWLMFWAFIPFLPIVGFILYLAEVSLWQF